MKTYKRNAFIMGMVVSIALMNMVSLTWASEMENNSLRGIKEIRTFTLFGYPSNSDIDLRKEQIETIVELRLRLAGIKLLTREEFKKKEKINRAFFWVYIYIKEAYLGKYKYDIEIKLRQFVSLLRDPNLKFLTSTWEETIRDNSGNVRDIKEDIKDKIDEFINDYLSVNPK